MVDLLWKNNNKKQLFIGTMIEAGQRFENIKLVVQAGHMQH